MAARRAMEHGGAGAAAESTTEEIAWSTGGSDLEATRRQASARTQCSGRPWRGPRRVRLCVRGPRHRRLRRRSTSDERSSPGTRSRTPPARALPTRSEIRGPRPRRTAAAPTRTTSATGSGTRAAPPDLSWPSPQRLNGTPYCGCKNPASFTINPGDTITVAVSTPFEPVSPFAGAIFGNPTISADVEVGGPVMRAPRTPTRPRRARGCGPRVRHRCTDPLPLHVRAR